MTKRAKSILRIAYDYCFRKNWLILLISLFLTIPSVYAQNGNEITGTVFSSGEPLVGASVIEDGTTNGTMVDIDGNFKLKVGKDASIIVTYIGFKTKVVKVGSNKVLNIELAEDSNVLEEVVAIGYGVQKKKLNTGATLQVKGDDLTKRNTTNAFQALKGQTPGLQIAPKSGQPGDGFSVLIRGVGTSGDATPLYVVDGIQVGDISHINNADIESIDVLKDAASAAIFGSQAGNGVILITTKTGSKGKAQVSLDAYFGIQSAPRKPDMLNAREYATIMNEANMNSGNKPHFTQSEIDKMGTGTTWMDQMFSSNVPTQNYVLSASGGTDASVYSTSLGYTSQGGIVGGKSISRYDRYSFRINTEHKLYKNIVKLGQHATFTYIKKQGVQTGNQYGNSLRGALNVSPLLPMYDDNGNFVNTKNPTYILNGEERNTWTNIEANPYASMLYNNQNKKNEQKLVGDVYLEIEPIKKLKLRTTIGLDYYVNEDRSYTPVYELSNYAFSLRDQAYQSMSKGRTWNWDNLLSYSFDINKDHNIDAMIGSSARQYTGTWLNGTNVNLSMSGLDKAWLDNATNDDGKTMKLHGGQNSKDQLLSYFSRIHYNLKETYMLNATFRVDGTSKFHKDERFKYYPSLSAGWTVTNEPWMQSSHSWMDYLKLRASWGRTGNQNVDAYQYLGLITATNADYIFGNGEEGGNTPGAYPSSLSNLALTWETSDQLNFGFDARFLNGKLNANFDWYRKSTMDWLVPVPVIATAGVQSRLINGGDVTNQGVELGLSYNDMIGKDFSYNISGNITYNKNKAKNIATPGGIIHGNTNELYANSTEFNRIQNGQPIGFFWGWKTNGIFQNQAEIDNYKDANGNAIQPNAVPGDVIYQDLNGDGKINDLDKTNIGKSSPDVMYGLNFAASYKGFDLQISANGVFGNKVVQTYRDHSEQFANYTTRILDRWHGEGTSNKVPRVTNSNINWQFSDLYLQDGDFFRISDITIGYDLSRLFKVDYISQARLYFSVQNAFVFTNYDGMDPEIGYGTSSWAKGVDVGFYPIPRTFLMGVNIKF